MYTSEIFIINENDYGFHIMCDNNIIMSQEYKPDLEGYQKMNKEDAEFYANAVLCRLIGGE